MVAVAAIYWGLNRLETAKARVVVSGAVLRLDPPKIAS